MRKAWVIVLSSVMLPASLLAMAPATGTPEAADQIQAGYAVVTPTSGDPQYLQVAQTFRFAQGSVTAQSDPGPLQLTTHALLFLEASTNLGRDLGVAITNPGSTDVLVTFTLRRNDGANLATQSFYIPGRWQFTHYVTEIFAGFFTLTPELTGTLDVASTGPVSILAVRFRGLAFGVELPRQLSKAVQVPQLVPGVGGDGSVLLPDYIYGGGWITEIVLMNTGSSDLLVRLDLFNPRGDPLGVPLNGATRSTILDIRVRAGGVLVIVPAEVNPYRP
jgi:hypothetical protein